MVATIKHASSGASPSKVATVSGAAREHGLTTDIFSANEELVHRLKELFDSGYFLRTWCVQEVVASNWCLAKCEDLEINFVNILSSVIHIIFRRTSTNSGRPLQFWNMRYMLKQPGRSKMPVLPGHNVECSVGPSLYLLGGTRDLKSYRPTKQDI